MTQRWLTWMTQTRRRWHHLSDPPKSPLKRGTLSGLVPSFLKRVRTDQKAFKHSLVSILFLVILFVIGISLPIAAQQSPLSQPAQTMQAASDAKSLDQQARQHYEAAQYAEAVTLWQQAIATFKAEGNHFGQIQTLSNLSLAYQQLGQWENAKTAIAASLDLIQTSNFKPQTLNLLLAQALDIQGRLQLSQGHTEAALTTWKQAAALYTQQQDQLRLTRNRINQAQALQSLGLYDQAQTQLTATTQILQQQPDSDLKAIGLRSLGNVLRLTGNFTASQQALQQSLAIATTIANSQAKGEALLSLGQTAAVQGDLPTAIGFYRQAATYELLTAVPAQLHHLDCLLTTQQFAAARSLLPPLQAQINQLPLSRTAVYARIAYARSVLQLPDQDRHQTAQIVAIARQQARSLQDVRAESYAIGTLGQVYEQAGQWGEATTLTRQALGLAQTLDATDIAYQWQWQLGRLLRQQQDLPGAIAAYDAAVKLLQTIRSDLVTANPDVQFSFRDQVEPVYRQFVDLLLQPVNGVAPSQAQLRQARTTLEALQLAELDNFFRTACLAPKQPLDAVVDQADPTAAIVYATILRDRIAVILKLPQQPLIYTSTLVPQPEVEQTLAALRRNITEPDALQRTQRQLQQVYNWLILPNVPSLSQHTIKTLVFVLDGALRNVPMAALYDGQQYLVEQYAIALSPSLHLFEPKPLTAVRLNALVVGLGQSRHGFPQLPYVSAEVKQIQSTVPSQVLLDQQFTTPALQTAMTTKSFAIAHLATHGQFSSKATETFILAWDQPINVNQLNQLLRSRDQQRSQPLELLVLSACETAAGDQRATLGLAGVALRAGARSTIASLWSVSDESTAVLMNQFYQTLIQPSQSRAIALQQAQLTLLKNPQYRLPLFWAPYVLIGNWL